MKCSFTFQLQIEPIKSGSGSKYEGIIQACRAIAKEEGIPAFWKGHVPAQLLSVVFGVSQVSTVCPYVFRCFFASKICNV